MAKKLSVAFHLNGDEVIVTVEPHRSLLYTLREVLDLTGTKQACDCEGECGACTVLLDGAAVRSCLVPIGRVAGRRVVTIEGLGSPEQLHPLQQAFIDHGAVQCGYCTPGMILSAEALLRRELNPSREQIVEALEGNLCLCTGYTKIVEAVEAAAVVMRGDATSQDRVLGSDKEVVGASQIRLDALEKVTGTARYAEDIKMPGLLHAALVRSPHPHARVLEIDPTPARGLPGVVCVLTAADIPGLNTLEGYSRNEPLLTQVGDSVKMIGDAVALVVGESPEAARAGTEAVRIEYEPLPQINDAVEAMEPSAVAIYPGGNVLGSYEIEYADLEASLAGWSESRSELGVFQLRTEATVRPRSFSKGKRSTRGSTRWE